MNKKLYFTVCVSFLCAFFAVFCIGSVFYIKRMNNLENAKNIVYEKKSPKIQAQNVISSKLKYYFVIYENGKINTYGVYDNVYKKLEGTLDKINVMTMRDNDREMFKKGIAVSTKEDLIHLVEDYTG